MTLDEAIIHAEEVAEEKRYEYQECLAVHDMEDAMNCEKCAEEHRQLAEWLKELKKLRELTRWIPVSEKLPEIHNYSDNYLVTLKRGGVYIAMFTECDGKHWWTYDDVVAWMPLHTPYGPQEVRKYESCKGTSDKVGKYHPLG